MADHKFQEQVDRACSAGGWDQGTDTSAPTDQAMGGGGSTIKEKCNAATEGTDDWEDD